jgi:CHAT domain-containing protein
MFRLIIYCEVVGLGFYLTESGAKAAIATLWKIDDPCPEALMGRFYAKLSQADLPLSRYYAKPKST